MNDKIERIMKKIIEEKEVEMQKITGTKKKITSFNVHINSNGVELTSPTFLDVV